MSSLLFRGLLLRSVLSTESNKKYFLCALCVSAVNNSFLLNSYSIVKFISQIMEESLDRAIFLDRDGVINEDRVDYVKSWEEFRFIKGVRRALKQIHQAGIPVVVISNQSVVGRGIITEADLSVIHSRLLKEVQKSSSRITKVFFCPHHPDAHCRCRQPRIGMLKKAARELGLDLKKCFFVGDNLKDIQAGNRAGCRTVLVQTGQGKESLKKILTGKTRTRPDWVCDDLSAAVPNILAFFKENP